jgi:outer membrane lipoprotein SlyB
MSLSIERQDGADRLSQVSAGRPDDVLIYEWSGRQMLCKMFLAKNTAAPTLLAIALGLSACGGGGADYRPVVDMSGHTEAAYDRDLAACQRTARTARNNTNVAEDAGIGAAGGGAIGAVAGAMGGNPLLGAGAGALAGLVGGGGYEETKTENREERIVKNCVRARGYAILG